MDPLFYLEAISPQGPRKIAIGPQQRQSRLSDLLRQAGLPLNTRCGQRGLCGGCHVELIQGKLVHRDNGTLVCAEGRPVSVRGCEYRPAGPENVHLSIPARSLLAYEPQVVSDFKINVPRAHDPLWQTAVLDASELFQSPHTLESITKLLIQRLKLEGPLRVEESCRRSLDASPSSAKLHAVVEYRGDHWLLTSLSATPPAPPLGVAIDVGTTTVVVQLVDLASGEIKSHTTGFNRQMHLGDDVLTRINLCSTDKSMLPRLQQAVIQDTIQHLLLKAMRSAEASDNQIACLAIAGNTIMLHLLAGVDPSPMGFAPFTPPFTEYKALRASSVHLHLSSEQPAASGKSDETVNAADPILHLLPSCAAYIGADLTAGIFASGLIYDQGPSLLVDVGTNGEIILKHGDKLLGCATAAGPAFEGSRLASGMRAGQGAISHIRMRANPFTVETDVISHVKPTGMCGSAYVDFLAQARKVGLIGPTGRFVKDVGQDRLMKADDGTLAFQVDFGHGKAPILVTETDIASLLQAKAAIAAGILTLLHRVGLEPAQVKTLYLAGGFGMHMDTANAIACGMLPGFRLQQVQLVGNTSLAGAYLSLLDSGVMDELRRIARALDAVELNLDPNFESLYIDQLQLPE